MTTVLVVDDQPGMRETIVELLEMSGYRTLAAVDGEEAITIAGTEDIDVVVTDVRMPGKDGVQVLLEVKGPPPEVILITAYTAEDRLAVAHDAKPFAIAHKPVPPAHLLSLVKAAAAARVNSGD